MHLPSVLLDFVVWDNDYIYALVTIVSVIFAGVLIAVVMRQSKGSHEQADLARAEARARLAARREQQLANEPGE